MLVETLTNGNTSLEIHQDECAESPREWDNLGTMGYAHRHYVLGDKEMEVEELNAIEANERKYIALPLYLFDHSGITMNTTGFSCPWDSGKVGVIFVSREKVREKYGWKVITEKRKQQIIGYLENEVKTFDQYIRGEVYGFNVIVNGKETDSCWGFFGDDHKKSGLFEQAQWNVNKK